MWTQRLLPRASRHSFPRHFFRAQSATSSSSARAASRLERLNARLPRFLHRYTTTLANAPLSHVSAFLLLHEITAVLPLFGLAGLFHYTQRLPPVISEGKWINDGVEKFGKWFRKRGWIQSGEDLAAGSREVEDGALGTSGTGSNGTRWVVEFATAYALVKVLLPVRIIFSVWAAPWCARVFIVPSLGMLRRASAAVKSQKP